MQGNFEQCVRGGAEQDPSNAADPLHFCCHRWFACLQPWTTITNYYENYHYHVLPLSNAADPLNFFAWAQHHHHTVCNHDQRLPWQLPLPKCCLSSSFSFPLPNIIITQMGCLFATMTNNYHENCHYQKNTLPLPNIIITQMVLFDLPWWLLGSGRFFFSNNYHNDKNTPPLHFLCLCATSPSYRWFTGLLPWPTMMVYLVGERFISNHRRYNYNKKTLSLHFLCLSAKSPLITEIVLPVCNRHLPRISLQLEMVCMVGLEPWPSFTVILSLW